jgi:hypothetical protein
VSECLELFIPLPVPEFRFRLLVSLLFSGIFVLKSMDLCF